MNRFTNEGLQPKRVDAMICVIFVLIFKSNGTCYLVISNEYTNDELKRVLYRDEV